MKKKGRRIQLGRKVREWMDIPMEAFGGSVKVTMASNAFVMVENHRGVFACTQTSIRFQIEGGLLCVEGDELVLLELTGERAVVRGGIKGLQFEK